MVGGVGDDVQPPAGERGGQQRGQFRGDRGLGRAGALAGQVQACQHRQAPGPGAERQRHDDPDGDEAVPERQFLRVLRAAVMLPPGAVHLRAGPDAYRVVQRDGHVRARVDQGIYDQAGNRQAELVELPAGPGEEVVRAVMRPGPLQARAQQHAHHGTAPDLPGQAGDQAAERGERRRGETRAHRHQDTQQGYR